MNVFLMHSECDGPKLRCWWFHLQGSWSQGSWPITMSDSECEILEDESEYEMMSSDDDQSTLFDAEADESSPSPDGPASSSQPSAYTVITPADLAKQQVCPNPLAFTFPLMYLFGNLASLGRPLHESNLSPISLEPEIPQCCILKPVKTGVPMSCWSKMMGSPLGSLTQCLTCILSFHIATSVICHSCWHSTMLMKIVQIVWLACPLWAQSLGYSV